MVLFDGTTRRVPARRWPRLTTGARRHPHVLAITRGADHDVGMLLDVFFPGFYFNQLTTTPWAHLRSPGCLGALQDTVSGCECVAGREESGGL